MSIPDILVELLRGEYPFLRPDHDPDIERYFELRAAGRPVDALTLYRSRLIPRYPDAAFRTLILRAYRLRTPEYSLLLERAYELLGKRLMERTKRILKYIALRAESYDAADAYSTIKAAESILAMLPRDRFEAVAALERYSRYARRIDYCAGALSAAEDLVRAYVTESLSVLEEERQRREERKRLAQNEERRLLVERDKSDLEEERRKRLSTAALAPPARRPVLQRRTAPAPIIDLSSIRFSAADLARIQIPPTLTKVEDQTLAYCFKYWNLVADAAFERVLFLYSRKYRTKHYEVYSAIRRGRMAAARDDETLSSVMALLITGYYYSIQGDVYLQRNWTRLKGKLEKPAVPTGISGTAIGRPPLRRRPALQALGSPVRNPGAAVENPAAAPVPAVDQAFARQAPVPAAPRTRRAAPGAEGRTEYAPPAARPGRRGGGTMASPPRGHHQDPVSVTGGSVSDRLRRLSGRSYDVYRDLFLAKVRPAVRRVLGRDKGLFHTVPVESENLVYEFLRTHYADPYLDWAGSEARSRLAAQGYALESVDPIIEECYRAMTR